MPALTVPQLCRLAVAAAADREASYVTSAEPKVYGRYTRWYRECVERVLAHERLTATPQEADLIYILAACGEASDIARAYLGTPHA
jgi:hypothetical protein